MRTRYRNVCAFLPAIFNYFADATGMSRESRSNDQKMVGQKPSRPMIILFLSTFLTGRFIVRSILSFPPARRPRRDEEARRYAVSSSVVYSLRFLRVVFGFVFTERRRRRPWGKRIRANRLGSMN